MNLKQDKTTNNFKAVLRGNLHKNGKNIKEINPHCKHSVLFL